MGVYHKINLANIHPRAIFSLVLHPETIDGCIFRKIPFGYTPVTNQAIL